MHSTVISSGLDGETHLDHQRFRLLETPRPITGEPRRKHPGARVRREGEVEMRLTKMFGLAALAAVAAMAFLGASSAMAELPTTLCEEESASLTCPAEKQAKSFTMLATTTTLLASVEVLCLHSSAKATVEGETLTPAGTPLGVQLSELQFKECGRVSTGSHSDCTVTVLKQPLLQVLKTKA